MKQHALANFGSGWTWLTVGSDKQLKIVNTDDANNPLKSDNVAIAGIDIWEHAYYLDTQNDRGKYIENFFAVICWDYISANYNKAIQL